MRKITFALCAALLIALAAMPVEAQEAKGITAYQEIVDLAQDGSALVTTNITLTGWDSDKLELPLNFASAENIVVEGNNFKATATAGKTGDVKVIKLQFDAKPPADTKVKITYTAKGFLDFAKAKTPRGIYNLSYTFTNATSTNIGKYDLKILLPTGYSMNGVGSSTPKATGEEVVPPYDFSNENNRLAANLHSPTVASGKNAAIAFGFQKDSGNPLLVVIVGIIIVAASLYLKRDVLTRPDFVKEVSA
jgi:hypothetical protein